MLDSPKLIVELLAKSLPSQGTYFIQISIVSTVVHGGMELLRVVPVAMAILRSFIGPRLTEKERRTTYLGLRPLADPLEFQHAYFTSQAVLYFMVLLVYSVISPLTNFFLAFCFRKFREPVLRSQLHLRILRLSPGLQIPSSLPWHNVTVPISFRVSQSTR